MARLVRPLFAVALLAFASLAHAESLRLLAPASGVTLRGGSQAELRWSAERLPAATEEWEAFLSINGGRYYAFRVTPHLDIALRRFTFIVPNVDTRDARIMIRTGDETDETHFESPGTFAIVRDPNAEEPVHRLRQFGRGEAARDGDPAVMAWASGARNGSGLSQQSSTTVPADSFGTIATAAADVPALLVPASVSVASPTFLTTLRSARGRYVRRAESRPSSLDLLLVCRRRNI
jgi:hypothetical protein